MNYLVRNRVVVPMVSLDTLRHDFDVIVYGRTTEQLKFLACEELQAVRKKYRSHTPGHASYEPHPFKGAGSHKHKPERQWR